MKYFVYILFSELIQKFYIGQTQNLCERIKRHNSGFEKFTSKGKTWTLKYYTSCESRAEAFKLERKIKNFKSQKRTIHFIDKEISEGRGSRKLENRLFSLIYRGYSNFIPSVTW